MSHSPTAAFALTDAQVRFFQVFGYLKLPGLFKHEIGTIAQHFDAQFDQHADEVVNWVHSTHYDKTRRMLGNLPDRDPALFGLLADARVQGIARSLLGGAFNYIPSEGNIFSGDTMWHTDAYNPIIQLPDGHTYFKLALYLDRMTAEHGAFRVIPGSHHYFSKYTRLLNDALAHGSEPFGLPPEKIPCTIIESEPGDALIFNFRTQHATCGTQGRRRMFYLGLAGQFAPGQDEFTTRIAAGYRKVFGRVYAEPLASTQDALLQECLQQFRQAEQRLAAQDIATGSPG